MNNYKHGEGAKRRPIRQCNCAAHSGDYEGSRLLICGGDLLTFRSFVPLSSSRYSSPRKGYFPLRLKCHALRRVVCCMPIDMEHYRRRESITLTDIHAFPMGQQAPPPPGGPGPPHYGSFTITHRHTLWFLWTMDRPVARTSTWQQETLTTDKHLSPPAGFEQVIPGSEWRQNHALDGAAIHTYTQLKIMQQQSRFADHYKKQSLILLLYHV